MNVDAILAKAQQACYDYKAVYGKFPIRIGVRSDYPFSLPPSIAVMELNPIPVQWTVEELSDESIPAANYTRYYISLEPVAGPGIKADEVYLPLPGREPKVIDSEFVARMAREFVE